MANEEKHVCRMHSPDECYKHDCCTCCDPIWIEWRSAKILMGDSVLEFNIFKGLSPGARMIYVASANSLRILKGSTALRFG